MTPIIAAVSTASQIANPENKKVAAVAALIGIAVIGFGLYKISNLLFKPFDKIVSVDGTGEVTQTSMLFRESGEGKKGLILKRPIVPQMNPPVKLESWKPSNYDTDRDIEERFYNCL